MKTLLDDTHELQLDATHYDGSNLLAEVSELIISGGHSAGTIVTGERKYTVTFESPVAHAVTEEFPSSLAGWIQGNDTGFLRIIENPDLRNSMGLMDVGEHKSFGTFSAYALLTAHEILVVYCSSEPQVKLVRPA